MPELHPASITVPVTGRTVHALGPGGTIRDWLASPVWSTPCEDLGELLAADGSPWGADGRWVLTNGPDVAPLKQRLASRRPLVTDQPRPEPVEGGSISWVAPGRVRTDTGTWSRMHTGADGLLDWSEFCFTPQYRHSVAATTLEVDQAEWRTLEVSCTGPVAVWVDDELVGSFTDVSYMEPVSHRVRVRLVSGTTTLFLATWQVAFREVRHVARVAVHGLPVRVVIPSPGADERASEIAERILDAVGVDAWALPGATVGLSGPVGSALSVRPGDGEPRRVVLEQGRADVLLVASPEHDAIQETTASMLSTGETVLTVRVDDDRCPVYRQLRVAVLPPRYRSEPEGTDPEVWRRELLDHVVASPPGVARGLAAIATGAQTQVRADDLQPALTMLSARADCADFQAVGLIHLWHEVEEGAWPAGLRDAVREALVGFKYWIDQPGLDAMCYFTENHQFVFHTAELLAGEAFHDEVFTNTGWTGAEHARHGRQLALEWMRRKMSGGFSEFDSNAYLAIDSLALVSLVDHAADPEVRARAEALLDKLLLTLAANSWKGIHGAAHGRSYTQTLRSSRFEETAPIMWALWGTGALNLAVLPATCLATSTRYRLPPLIRSVATAGAVPWWGRQVYHGGYRFAHDLLSRPYDSDLRVWRTEGAMLSSVQEYRSGLPGLQEHVWGATLSPEVQVFATHPASDSDSSSARPNAWAGQRVLPRARQDRDTVLVVHPVPSGGPAASTHVWFPVSWMDETGQRGSWLAGRVGQGYVAIACEGGLVATGAGDTAGQEWLPRGDGLAYVATVGCREQDGSFSDFVARLVEPDFRARAAADPGVAWAARDGRRLSLSWSGPFLVDGTSADLDRDGRPDLGPHLENPACAVPFDARLLEARHGGHRLVLDLRTGRRVEPSSSVAEGAGADVG